MASSVLVIGGGIGGINVALNLAMHNIEVYLVESSPTIGGLMARLNKTFPTNDCSICIEAPLMYEIQINPNIHLLTNYEIQRVSCDIANFKVRVIKKPRFIDEHKCKGCGKCAEVCPVSVTDEIDGKIGGRKKLINIPFPQSVPNVYRIDERCRYGKMKSVGACIGDCKVDCIQCRECPIARCVKVCKEEGADAIMLWQRPESIDIEVNSIVVATGLEPFEPPVGLYGYGIYKNVITNFQYERLTNVCGATYGKIVRPSDGIQPKSVVWIQCVGREQYIPYCSKICCMIATKQAIITKEHNPSIDTYILLYTDLKTHGKGFFKYRRYAEEQGVKYLSGKPAEIFELENSQSLKIRYENVGDGKIEELEGDIVVLSTGFVPRKTNDKLAKVLNIDLDAYGFFKEKDPIRAPFESTVEHIFVCGGAKSPVDISESIAQAIAVSLKAVPR